MSIFRVEKNRNYTTINNAFILDEELSWKAKGLLCYFLSRPDDWKFYLAEMIKHSKDGRDSTRSAISELEEIGYIQRNRTKKDGKIDGYDYIVYETPVKRNTCTTSENPTLENPTLENPTLLSTELQSTNNNIYCEVIEYLNQVVGSNFKYTTKDTKSHINARLKEGFKLDDFKKVIDIKSSQWLYDNNMSKYLRPTTLFGTKFESYLNEEAKFQEIESDIRVVGANA